MLYKVLICCSCVFILGGCIYKEEPVLEVDSGWKSSITQPAVTRKVVIKETSSIPAEWIPPSYLEKRWTAIVIHHSATSYGNAAIFDKWHKENNNWNGVGYDFVIGNGTDSPDGKVEVTYRWREQKTGAHCGGTLNNWANEEAVGICLVGNFNEREPSERQMNSLAKLVRFLQKRYGINKNRIFGHKDTPGARVTECPGRMFSMAKLKSML
jgi:N-acetylmuramoyl-L-alanine amidase